MLQNDVFYNRQNSGYDELVSYQPKYYQNIDEMQVINRFGGYTTDKMADDLEQFVSDQFIDSCCVKMLNRFETFLGITGYEKRSIDERRSIVKVNWIGNIKMNRTQIKALIRAYCGCDSEVHFAHEVIIVAKISESNSTIYAGDLLDIFNKRIPSHLKWTAVFGIESNSIKAGRSICYWRYDYTKCGTNPDVSTLGDAIETDFQVDPEEKSYLYEHEKTGSVVTGTTPRIGTVGIDMDASVAIVNNTNQYVHEYEKTGDLVAGTYPDTEIIGSISISGLDVQSDAETYTFDIEKCSKKEGEEER